MPDNLLFSIISILLLGFLGGQLARRLGAPPLLGMMIVGILLGPQVGNLIADRALNLADDLRTIAVMVILMRAGLGLDRDKLVKQSSVALRLGFLPALTEAIAVSLISIWLFQFDFLTGLLLGFVVSAESPAVIVPGMLRLKSLGWGVSKGIADAILTGSALSDVLVLLLFSLLVSFLSQGTVASNTLWLLPIKIIAQIILGVIIGYLTAKLIFFWVIKSKWIQNPVQETLITASLALLVVVLASQLPYFSGYLAVMAMGFFLIEFSPPLARRLRQEFNHLWIVAEIFLFVLMGATIQLQVLSDVLLSGIILLTFGLIFGRTIGWYLATVGSNWTWREKLFLLPGNSAKATVQAAIGAIPLSLGIPGGDVILAIAALSILITAPLGAWAIPTFAPKLLTQDAVDPTKTNVISSTVILGAIDTSSMAISVLTKVADLARRTNGKAVIIHIANHTSEAELQKLQLLANKLLLDIPHQFVTATGSVPVEVLRLAQEHKATYIVLGKSQNQSLEQSTVSSISHKILQSSPIPVTLVK